MQSQWPLFLPPVTVKLDLSLHPLWRGCVLQQQPLQSPLSLRWGQMNNLVSRVQANLHSRQLRPWNMRCPVQQPNYPNRHGISIFDLLYKSYKSYYLLKRSSTFSCSIFSIIFMNIYLAVNYLPTPLVYSMAPQEGPVSQPESSKNIHKQTI